MDSESHILRLPRDVLRALVRGLSTGTFLSLRSTCKLFKQIMPIDLMLPGLSADTLRWTALGSSVWWDKTFQTTGLQVQYRHLPLSVEVGGVDLVDPMDNMGIVVARRGMFSYRVSGADGSLGVHWPKDPDGVTEELFTRVPFPRMNDYVLYAAGLNNAQITVTTRALDVFVMEVKDTAAGMIAEYERVLSGPPTEHLQKQNFPERMNWFNRVKKCIYQGADVLWLLTCSDPHQECIAGSGTVVRVQAGVFEYMYTGVEDMHALDNALVLLKCNGTLWIRTSDGKLRSIMVFGHNRITAVAVTPELSCLWVRFDHLSFIRHGAPFLLPVGGVEDDCQETVALLKAKLARAERRIERLMK
jgi:hypothetical protein